MLFFPVCVSLRRDWKRKTLLLLYIENLDSDSDELKQEEYEYDKSDASSPSPPATITIAKLVGILPNPQQGGKFTRGTSRRRKKTKKKTASLNYKIATFIIHAV